VIKEQPAELAASDKWILAELGKLVEECKKGYDEYNFFIPANAIRDFTWLIFAAHYIEMVKGRAYVQDDDMRRKSALYALHRCFSTILLLLAPITPFITEDLWTKIYSDRSIHLESMYRGEKIDQELLKYTKQITDFNSLVWNKKKETVSSETGKPLSLKDPIEMRMPEELQPFKADLKAMHNLITK
jgi:valyl-tRNA synthetase